MRKNNAYGTGTKRAEILNRLLKKYNNICYLCDQKLILNTKHLVTIDHVVSLIWGGTDTEDNWAPVHSRCNCHKEHKGAVKIYVEMDLYLERISSFFDINKSLNTNPNIAHSIALLFLYAQEMPGLFGLSYRYVKTRNSRKGRSVNLKILANMYRLDEIVESFNIPKELFNQYYDWSNKANEQSKNTNQNFLSIIYNPSTWYKCNSELIKKIARHPKAFKKGIQFLGRNHKNQLANEFVKEFLTDILLEEYHNNMLNEVV